MPNGGGHIELDRPVASIRVGPRHRRDLGDIDRLATSIRTLGLLQPITISPDGMLICGARRLAAVRQLGLARVNVWIRSGISTPLQHLLAEQDDNGHHKPLSPTEAAALYQEIKQLLAEDASRRQEASRFDHTGPAGPADSAGPQPDTRAAAAMMVTGTNGYTRLEQVSHLQRLAADPSLPDPLRQLVADALGAIEDSGRVNGHYQQVRAALAHARPDPAAHTFAPGQNAAAQPSGDRPATPAPDSGAVRRFQLLWSDLLGWTEHFDPGRIGPALNDDQWTAFQDTVAATVVFLQTAEAARAGQSVAHHPTPCPPVQTQRHDPALLTETET